MRGQQEIIGMVIIVIMISIGFLFFAKFAIDSNTDKSVFVRKGLSYSTMSAILNTQVECRTDAKSMGEQILEDCLLGSRVMNYCDSDQTACELFVNVSTTMLEQTVAAWGKNFELRVFKTSVGYDPELEFDIKSKNCMQSRNYDSSGLFSLNLGEGNNLLAQTMLIICD